MVKVSEPHLLVKMEKEPDFDLTLVVPAYNEESRLPVMMKDTIKVRVIHLYIVIINIAF